MEKNIFTELSAIDVSKKIEKKNGLSYLSWSWAWSEFKKRCPNAKYEIKMFNGLPYVFDEKTGYMVFTSVTVGDITHDMWLCVMDGNNKAMKDKPYEYMTKFGKKTVASATMFDINKTIMRCLVKNLAMYGLGLYIYAGEDLPEDAKDEKKEDTTDLILQLKSLGTDEKKLCQAYKVEKIEDMTSKQLEDAIAKKEKAIKMLISKKEK